MMLGVIMTDIFRSQAHTLVCPVNTVGVMGAGLAKAFAERFDGLLNDYRQACRKGELTVEKPWIFHVNDDRAVLCLATKKHWRHPSELEWIRAGVEYTAKHYENMGIRSLAVPMLGCGLGGLDWKDVYPLIYSAMDDIDLPVETVEPMDR